MFERLKISLLNSKTKIKFYPKFKDKGKIF